ncbi:MAG: LysR family transcriptional regulator, partial [Aeromonadaceae bacterium]
LALRPLPFTCARQHYHLIWHQRHQQDPAHQWFRELTFPFLSQHLQQGVAASAQLLAQQHTDNE